MKIYYKWCLKQKDKSNSKSKVKNQRKVSIQRHIYTK